MTPLEKVWKYTALGASSIVFEEANPIFGGIAARHGRVGMFGVVVAVALGTWAASMALYYIGRWRIDWVRARWPEKKRLLDGALAIVERHPWRASLARARARPGPVVAKLACLHRSEPHVPRPPKGRDRQTTGSPGQED